MCKLPKIFNFGFSFPWYTYYIVPLERKVLIREHLNNWYSLKAYYLAKLLADIPFQIIFPTLYLVIVYFMTNQPLSLLRFSMLLCMMIFTSLVGQGIGLVVGAIFDIQSAAFMGPTFAIRFYFSLASLSVLTQSHPI
jgi:L-cystine uptake protein TcyP (sodium:dicarboxylate symporter family)